LPDREYFEFKVYSLNEAVCKAYQGKADVVVDLDPDNPGYIPVDKADPEPTKDNKS
jgi:hypothetical protein